MSGREIDTPAVQGTAVVTVLERQLAVAHWLLSAAEDQSTARDQWQDASGVALLAGGGIISAVRAPAQLVWAAAGTEELTAVDNHLRRWLDGGAVFMDRYSALYYFLVPGSTTWKWSDRELPGVECLGRDWYLGVPAMYFTEPHERSYWCVPMDSPGNLCYPDEVEALLRAGLRMTREEETIQ